ncbi:hypothetical protein SSX86_015252 [Deinandra increscens subsp. villosa]|uniref:PWI domain-containing protein n=1 Tax=Deinandra increscens subsp. villosa TaxID=3103831 RepID=A0AAP0GY28_9ASTR
MSGGFFRGTTADQDTRFSNKHAKLLKSHKFPPELENLVDMTKVKMDVMRPWIAHRATELLGFEDEVLINFIYGLLEEKVVNGKEIQISLTGFMEKNTGKFMKELWTHLLSAQQNASGVPQQFLDAKEEETRKKQEDMDRITRELKRTKEKEGREHEPEKVKMDREAVDVKAANLETHSRRRTKFSSKWSAEDKEKDETNGSKETARLGISQSPRPADHSMSPPRGTRSRSISKSFSTSRSHSRSRSLSASPKALRRSVSVGRRSHSLSRRSSTPRRVGSRLRSPSPAPLRGRSPSPARRRLRSPSPAPSRRRSPSPARRRLRSPARRRSRSPVWRRSRSPIYRRSRSPVRRRSRSPVRRRSRSPVRRRSRSPLRRRSRSPLRRRSRSPLRRRSRSPVRRRSRSPVQKRSRSPIRRRSPSPFQRRPQPPYRHRSPPSSTSPPVRGRSPSPVRRQYQGGPSTPPHSPIRRRTTVPTRQRSPSPGSRSSSPSGRVSVSPTRGSPPSYLKRGSPKRQQRSPVARDEHRFLSLDTFRNVQRNAPDHEAPRKETAERSLSVRSLERDPKGRRIPHNGQPALSLSPYKSPSSSVSPPAAGRSPSQERGPIPPKRQSGSMSVKDRLGRVEVGERISSRVKEDKRENKGPVNDKHDKDKLSHEKLASHHSRTQVQNKSKNDDGRRNHPELLPGKTRDSEIGYKAGEMNQEAVKLPIVERHNQSSLVDTGSDESEPKRKHKGSKRKDATSDEDSSHDSRNEDRKEAKRRRKEEKRLRKEEKHKRREERRRKKESRRSEKLKLKAGRNDSLSSNFDKSHDSPDESTLVDQKKLEIELREKAIESLRAKKGVGH